MPARVVVVLGNRVQTEGQIVVRADPLRRINGPGLQRGEHVAAGHGDSYTTGALENLSAETGNTHAQTLEIGKRVDLGVEPPPHLNPRVTARKRDEPEWFIELLPELEATSIIDPAVHFLSRKAEWHSCEERCLGRLATPVVSGSVPHLGVRTLHRVEHIEGPDELTGTIDLDVQPSGRHLAHVIGKTLRARAQTGKVLRPGRDHLPAEGLLRHRGGALRDRRGGIRAAGNQQIRCQQDDR